MRILMISALEVWALSSQGGAPSLFKTLEGFGRRGHQVDFVAPTIGANHQHGTRAQSPPAIDGVTFHLFHLPTVADFRLPVPRLAAKADQKLRFALLFPLLASRKAKQLLGRQAYDLLYGYELHGVLAQRLVRRRRMLPVAARFQGTVMYPYLDKPLSLLRKYEEILALKTPADLYVMTDDGTRGDEVLARLNAGSAGKVCFWRNGLDLDHTRRPTPGETRQARVSLGLAEDEFVLVTSSRLARWKRIDRAIDAVAFLRKDHGVRARLLIVGDGEERDNLTQQAADLGVSDAVTFVGAVPQADVRRYLWAADVFLSVSELSNVGNPLLEAMVTARCILTIDAGDTGDLIRDGVTGVLLPDGEPHSIATALARLAADDSGRHQLAAKAHEFASRNFWSWQQRIDAEVDALEALVSTARGRASADVAR